MEEVIGLLVMVEQEAQEVVQPVLTAQHHKLVVQLNNQVNQANQVITVTEITEVQGLLLMVETVAAEVAVALLKQVKVQNHITMGLLVVVVMVVMADNQILQVHKFTTPVAEEAVAEVHLLLKVLLQEAKVVAVTEIQDQEEQTIIQDKQTQAVVQVVVMMVEVLPVVQV